jgi:hypothetical protein
MVPSSANEKWPVLKSLCPSRLPVPVAPPNRPVPAVTTQ